MKRSIVPFVLKFKCVAHHIFIALCVITLVVTPNLTEDNVEEYVSFVNKIVDATYHIRIQTLNCMVR